MSLKRATSNPIVVYGIVAVASYYLVIKPLLQSLNLMDTREEKDAAKLQSSVENAELSKDYWNPNYLKQAGTGYNVYLMPEADMRLYSKRIYDAQGTFNDDEEAIYAVFRQMRYKTQVAFLAYWFNKLYKKDLYTFLRDGVFNKDELATLLTIINKLPTGFVKK